MFIEKFYRTLLYIIKKSIFIDGYCNWANIFNDAVETFNNNKHTTTNMTTVDASNNLDKFKYIIPTSTEIKLKLKVGDYVRNADKRNIFSKCYTSNWDRQLF